MTKMKPGQAGPVPLYMAPEDGEREVLSFLLGVEGLSYEDAAHALENAGIRRCNGRRWEARHVQTAARWHRVIVERQPKARERHVAALATKVRECMRDNPPARVGAERLNAAGVRTLSGKPWTRKSLLYFIGRYGDRLGCRRRLPGDCTQDY